MSITFHKVLNIPFYSLDQFTQLEAISRGNSVINLCQHNESKEVFVVKEVPYQQQKIKIYQILTRLSGIDGLVRIRGLCRMQIKFDRLQNKRNHQITQKSLCFQPNQKKQYSIQFNNERREKQRNQKQKQQEWLIIFMERCPQNLNTYIKKRRKERKFFKCEQIISFMNQALHVLQSLQKLNISHRDIKPQNFLYQKGKFKLCDFQNSIFWDPEVTHKYKKQLDITSVEYTSPQFFRNLRQPKDKVFDPFKLDLYSFGIMIIYMCSMGQFDLSQRRQYLQQNSVFHSNFMKQQRRRYLKNSGEFKSLSTIVKMMLEQDEYKRDNFQTFLMKTRPVMNLRQLEITNDEEAMSDNYKSQQSISKLNNVQSKYSRSNKEVTIEIKQKSLKSLITIGLAFFVLLLII